MLINKDKLAKRQEIKEHNPDFIRPESWRYVRLQTNWRKPKGIDHHQRKQKSRGRPGLVKVGYRGPKEARGLHPSGFTDNLVHNLNDLEKLDPKKDGVRFGHSVGTRKRKIIVAKAIEGKFKIKFTMKQMYEIKKISDIEKIIKTASEENVKIIFLPFIILLVYQVKSPFHQVSKISLDYPPKFESNNYKIYLS